MLKRVLIANRGEIALRILRSCREAGIETVAVYSQADREALHVQMATQAVCIGPARAADSYLNQTALLTAAQATGCDGIHPGYGFLSENADFADACAQAGLTFIGPSGAVIRRAGAKSAARTIMRKAGVPVTPGSDGPVRSEAEALAAAERVGYPVMLKASAGGGGRGIRRCAGAEELPAALREAQAETRACFGDEEMYLEKLALHPRHIEVQILADRQGNVVHLGDRDCSLQRRSQKLVEEAPAWGLSPELRARYTSVALDKAERLEDLINEFFDVTRFNLTHMELEKRPCDLSRMLQQVASEFAPMLEERELTCRLDLPETLPYSCDPDKLARVFDNLLRNACHYSEAGTAVAIAAQVEEGETVLTFTNTGVTIPPDKLGRIFEQFFRLDSSRASRTGGAGLGLAIALEIVELHGGTIAAQSQDGVTTFTVRLPAS